MLTGVRPFEEEAVHALLDKIVIGEFKFPEKSNLKPSVVELITKILNPNPRKRLTISQIKDSEWFQEGGYLEDQQLLELQKGRELLEIKSQNQVPESLQKSEEDKRSKSPGPVTLEVNFNQVGPASSAYDLASLSSYYDKHPGLVNSRVQPKVQPRLNAFTLISQLTGQKMQQIFENKNKKPPGTLQSALGKNTFNLQKHPSLSKVFFTDQSAASIFLCIQEALKKHHEPRITSDKGRLEMWARYYVKLKNVSEKNKGKKDELKLEIKVTITKLLIFDEVYQQIGFELTQGLELAFQEIMFLLYPELKDFIVNL